jgi:hypothetical protein
MAIRKNADGSVTVGIFPAEEKVETKKESTSSAAETPKKRVRKPKQQ